jgi:hypothetical protein
MIKKNVIIDIKDEDSTKLKHTIKISEDVRIDVLLKEEMSFEEFLVISNQIERMINPIIKRQIMDIPLGAEDNVIPKRHYKGRLMSQEDWANIKTEVENGIAFRDAYRKVTNRKWISGQEYRIAREMGIFKSKNAYKTQYNKSGRYGKLNDERLWDKIKTIMDNEGLKFKDAQQKVLKITYTSVPWYDKAREKGLILEPKQKRK